MIGIDKKKIYKSHGYLFKNFITLSYEEKMMVLGWRNSEHVRSAMVNKDIIKESDHLKFIESLRDRDDCYYWLVISNDGINMGVVDITHVDFGNDIGEIGFYLNPELIGMGLKFVVECDYFIYDTIKLGNNIGTVDVNNRAALLINKYLGTTYEGVKKEGDNFFYYNNHITGDYLITHYESFNVKDYMAFIRANKNIVNELKKEYHVKDVNCGRNVSQP